MTTTRWELAALVGTILIGRIGLWALLIIVSRADTAREAQMSGPHEHLLDDPQ